MAQIEYKFNSHSGESFTVVEFQGTEGISQLYRYEIELKAPLARAIELDDILDERATFIIKQNGNETPVHGILASFDEMQTVQGYVYYRAVLVPELWKLSIYKTNEIYTTEKTVDNIIQTVLQNANFEDGTHFNLDLLDTGHLLNRDYVCQFGESDFDFISRLLENEGIFYYFDHSDTEIEKIVFINDLQYLSIDQPDLIYEKYNTKSTEHKDINSWVCRKQRLPENISIQDYNSSQPSLEISGTEVVDASGSGTEYLYGGHIKNSDEVTYITELRAEQLRCQKTRFYAESSVARLQAGYSYSLDKHPNVNYNGQEYLIVEISHEGSHLDKTDSSSSGDPLPSYRNTFTSIDALTQYRPPLKTAKPRFFGTMTAFIYAETGSSKPEVNELGEYRVHLPFDRADGVKESSDPDRKSSAWMRMAQPYVGQDQGMYYPLTGGTEVLLTFINGDPDQPIISAAIPNAATPSLMEDNPEWVSSVTKLTSVQIAGNTHNISTNGASIATQDAEIEALQNPPPSPIPTGPNAHFINDGTILDKKMIPPWTSEPVTIPETDPPPPKRQAYDESLVKFKYYDKDFNARDMDTADLDKVSTDRSAGDSYVYANGRTFAYPQHERVYFIGTFHEDFHVKDDFITEYADEVQNTYVDKSVKFKSATGVKEQFNFPPPGEYQDFATSSQDPWSDSDLVINPDGKRGVSEDKRWGDQLFYAFGRSFNWSAGIGLGGVDGGGAFGVYNYGNGYTENLLTHVEGTSENIPEYMSHKDKWDYSDSSWKPGSPVNIAKVMAPIAIGITAVTFGWPVAAIKGGIYAASRIHEDGSSLAEDTVLNPGITAAEKTFGHTYSYHQGLAVDIHEGNSVSRTYGDSDDWTQGNSESVTQGDSVSTVYGSTSDAFLGSKYEFNLATSDALTIGMTTDTTIGVTTETFVGGKIEFELSASTGLSSTSESRAKAKEDKVSGNTTETALAIKETALATTVDSLKYNLKSIDFMVVTAGRIGLSSGAMIAVKSPSFMVNGVLIKLG